MSNDNQSEDSLSASPLRTRRCIHLREKPQPLADITRPKKAAKDSNKPKGPQIEEGSLREHAWKELLNYTESITNPKILPMSTSTTTGVLGMSVPRSRWAPDFDLCNPKDLKEFLEEFEELVERCRLMEREKAKMVVKYVDKETKKF